MSNPPCLLLQLHPTFPAYASLLFQPPCAAAFRSINLLHFHVDPFHFTTMQSANPQSPLLCWAKSLLSIICNNGDDISTCFRVLWRELEKTICLTFSDQSLAVDSTPYILAIIGPLLSRFNSNVIAGSQPSISPFCHISGLCFWGHTEWLSHSNNHKGGLLTPLQSLFSLSYTETSH